MKKKPQAEIDVQKLRIAHDPIIKRAVTESKYDDLFRKLSHGQCIVCDSGHANSLANVLRTYISRHGIKGKVKIPHRVQDEVEEVSLLVPEVVQVLLQIRDNVYFAPSKEQ